MYINYHAIPLKLQGTWGYHKDHAYDMATSMPISIYHVGCVCMGRIVQSTSLHLVAYTLEENWVFATNQFSTTYDYLLLATNVSYFYNYFLDLVMFATMFQLICN